MNQNGYQLYDILEKTNYGKSEKLSNDKGYGWGGMTILNTEFNL